ncbi:hypothetical protein DL95DRAFT_398531, partial [Leptodontidium sp. 2 PMI_412]
VPSGDVDLEAIKNELGRVMKQAAEEERRQITEPEEAREPNSWLCRVGWVDHLGHFDRKALRELVAPVKEDEPELQILCKAFDWWDSGCTVPCRSESGGFRSIVRGQQEGSEQGDLDAV